jgi:hypothetical protein
MKNEWKPERTFNLNSTIVLHKYQLRKYFLTRPSLEWIFLSTLDTAYQYLVLFLARVSHDAMRVTN